MISRERFNNIKAGEILIFNNGTPRKALKDVQNNCVRFKKVRGYGNTTYTYSDIYKQIIAIAKPKETTMSDNKHTEEFERIMTSGFENPTFAQAESFALKLSEELSEKVVKAIVAKTNKKFVTNKEIYTYCKQHGIEPDYDPFLNEQTKIDFEKEKVDFSTFKALDEIEHEGRTAIVMSNDTEKKVIVLEYHDNDEMKSINYGEK